MNRALLIVIALALSGCALLPNRDTTPYEDPFYAQFLNTGSQLDAYIRSLVEALRENPDSAPLHNELGQLLVQKGFPKDAEREFERAVNADPSFYQGWYNLGLVRAAKGDYSGARRAFGRTVRLMKGHAEALFQLGLMEEERGNQEAAIAYYAKALRHNPNLLDVRVNPRVLDTKLIHLALLHNYDREHARQSGTFLGTPAGYTEPERQAPSRQPAAEEIVPPAPPVTDPGTQTPPPPPGPSSW